jgi:hypothetical protein
MRWPVSLSVLLLALVVMSVAAACGGNSPSGPTVGGITYENLTDHYVSAVTLPGRTGMLFFNAVDQRGALTMDDAMSVPLGGTIAAGSVQLSGAGGYGVAGSVSSTRLSGSVTTPFGSGMATPVVLATPFVAQRGDLLGVFEATYSMRTNGFYRNINLTTGQTQRDCGYTVDLTGTLTLDVKGGAGTATAFRGDVRESWRETYTIVPPCSQVSDFSPTAIEGSSPGRSSIFDARDIQFGFDDRPDVGNGEQVRTWAFVGVLNSTTIEGRFFKSRRGISFGANSRHEEGYPLTAIAVTLRHR